MTVSGETLREDCKTIGEETGMGSIYCLRTCDGLWGDTRTRLPDNRRGDMDVKY